MRLNLAGRVEEVDGATQDRWRHDAAVAAVLGRVVGHRGPGSEAPVSSSGSGSSSSRSRSDQRGHEEGGAVDDDDDDLLVGDREGPEPDVADDQQWLGGQLDTLLSATAPAQPIGLGGIPWTPSAAPPASIDGEPLGADDNQDSGDVAAEESEEATLVDSAATSVVGAEDVALWPPPAGEVPVDHQERCRPGIEGVEVGATTAASPGVVATDANSAAGMLGYLEKKLDVRIGEVESRLTNALSGALSDISASQRAMIDQMTQMNDRMQSEAALQRDAHRSLAARVDALSLGGPPQTSTQAGRGPSGGLPVPTTPPRAFRPLDRQKKSGGGGADADAVMEDVADPSAGGHLFTPEKKRREKVKETGRGNEASSSSTARPAGQQGGGPRPAEPSPSRHAPVGDKRSGSLLISDDADPLFVRDPWLPAGATSIMATREPRHGASTRPKG